MLNAGRDLRNGRLPCHEQPGKARLVLNAGRDLRNGRSAEFRRPGCAVSCHLFHGPPRRASSASLCCGGLSGGSPSSRAFSRVTHIIVWLSAGGLCWQAFVPSCELFSFVKERCVTSAPNVDGALNDVERVFNFRPLDMFSNLFDSADAAPAQPNHHQRVFLLQEFPHFPKELF